MGQTRKAGNQTFAFDPAYNLIDEYGQQVKDNRIAVYNGIKFFYDDFGNTIHKEHSDGTTQNLYYDLFDRLVKVETFKKNTATGEWEKEVWAFEYDALGRRITKYRELSDGLKADETGFVWDGSHLLQEVYTNGRYTYIYTDVDSYEPLAQIHNYTNAENETYQEINYFHCDQIGIPREMTDKDGKLLWFGEYDAWGKLTQETNVTGRVHQPFRLQNQYCDAEIGLYYNFFRYYDPDVGRFVNQDPIGLWGGENLYGFAPNTQEWIDPLGLANRKIFNLGQGYKGALDIFDSGKKSSFEIHVYDPKGKEVGIYGPDGWFNKHGKKGKPEGIPDSVENSCRGIAVDTARRIGAVPPKGKANIKGNKLKKFMKLLMPD